MARMKQLEPQHATIRVPPNARQIGSKPDGTPIYSETIRRGRNVPLIINGEQAYRKHPTTAESLVTRRTLVAEERTIVYTLESGGNFNITREPYHIPTEAEIAADERSRKIKEMGGGLLGAALVDAGITPAELLEKLKGAPPVVEPTDEWAPDLEVFPKALDETREFWELSNGDPYQGDEQEAVIAESNVQALAAGQPLYEHPDAVPAY